MGLQLLSTVFHCLRVGVEEEFEGSRGREGVFPESPLSLSGVLLEFWIATVWSAYVVFLSRSGPVLGSGHATFTVPVWSVFGVLEFHGLVHSWSFSLSDFVQ